MKRSRIIIPGAGFGGLELSTPLPEALGDAVEVECLSGPKPTASFREPSAALVADKERFGSSRRACWFGC
jgi:hypothetical protein